MKREQVLPQVMADMAQRIAKGAKEYGEPLTTHNGRDALQDAYEEALDLALYLKQALLERDAKVPDLASKIWPPYGPSRESVAKRHPESVTLLEGVPSISIHKRAGTLPEETGTAMYNGMPEKAWLLLAEIHADAAYLFGRVAVDGSVAEMMAKSVREKIDKITDIFLPKDAAEPSWPGPDWSQAPEWAVAWAMDSVPSSRFEVRSHWYSKLPVVGYGSNAWAFSSATGSYDKASDFNYTGDWRESLRKRPE